MITFFALIKCAVTENNYKKAGNISEIYKSNSRKYGGASLADVFIEK